MSEVIKAMKQFCEIPEKSQLLFLALVETFPKEMSDELGRQDIAKKLRVMGG